jgi:hypothetical protein
MADDIAIRLTFTYTDPTYGSYCDALYFTQDEYAKLQPTDIDALKQARIDNFIAVASTPPDPAVILQQQLDDVNNQITALQAQIDSLTAQQTTLNTQATDLNTQISNSQNKVIQPLPPVMAPPALG